MNINTITTINEEYFSIELKEDVYISFIPFHIYSHENYTNIEKSKIRQINTDFEKKLISFLKA